MLLCQKFIIIAPHTEKPITQFNKFSPSTDHVDVHNFESKDDEQNAI